MQVDFKYMIGKFERFLKENHIYQRFNYKDQDYEIRAEIEWKQHKEDVYKKIISFTPNKIKQYWRFWSNLWRTKNINDLFDTFKTKQNL